MEALVRDPMNTETDQEVTILLNQYGLNDLRGPNRLVLERLSPGRITLKRQLIENEDYRAKVLAPQDTIKHRWCPWFW